MTNARSRQHAHTLRHAGESLLEVVVAVGVLTIAMGGSIGVKNQAFRFSGENRDFLAATATMTAAARKRASIGKSPSRIQTKTRSMRW